MAPIYDQDYSQTLSSVKDYMRRWQYNLVSSQLLKAQENQDEVGFQAFLNICAIDVLSSTSLMEQFVSIRTCLEQSPHKEEYVQEMKNAFTLVYGEVEGM
jgi:hypothetical protein